MDSAETLLGKRKLESDDTVVATVSAVRSSPASQSSNLVSQTATNLRLFRTYFAPSQEDDENFLGFEENDPIVLTMKRKCSLVAERIKKCQEKQSPKINISLVSSSTNLSSPPASPPTTTSLSSSTSSSSTLINGSQTSLPATKVTQLAASEETDSKSSANHDPHQEEKVPKVDLPSVAAEPDVVNHDDSFNFDVDDEDFPGFDDDDPLKLILVFKKKKFAMALERLGLGTETMETGETDNKKLSNNKSELVSPTNSSTTEIVTANGIDG